MPENEIRIDKWLWAVRIFKTRSIATEECKKGRVMIDGVTVKPSRNLKMGEVVMVRKLPVIYSYRVTGLIQKRVSAPLARENYEELTPEEELVKLKAIDSIFVKRDKGSGRPTKKDRREIEKFQSPD